MVGSNIFNIFFILGVSAVINPIDINSSAFFDLFINILVGGLMFLFVFTGKGRKINNIEGIILLLIYTAYTIYLIMN